MRFAIALLFAGAVAGAQDAQDQPETLKVDKEWAGGKTEITAAEYHRVTDTEAWHKLWQRHTGKKERAPEVDFDKSMVVACFLGPVTYDHVTLHAVRKTKEEILFGMLIEEDDCCDFSTRPQYYMAVVPRSTLKLAIFTRVKEDLDIDPRKDKLVKEIEEVKE